MQKHMHSDNISSMTPRVPSWAAADVTGVTTVYGQLQQHIQAHAFEQKLAVKCAQQTSVGDKVVAYGSQAHHSTLVQMTAGCTRFALVCFDQQRS